MIITRQPWARAVTEVLYSGGCPNHAPFVARLAALLAELGVDVEPGASDRTGYALQGDARQLERGHLDAESARRRGDPAAVAPHVDEAAARA
jgi:hypothetical protein